jgi:Putative mono-oxygenase ydhR
LVIVQVNYRYAGDPAEWAKGYTKERAALFVDLPGLEWKIWLDAPDESRTGGIYLFRDRASAEAYVNGPLLARHRNNPAVSELEIRISETRPSMNRLTRAPVPDRRSAGDAPRG